MSTCITNDNVQTVFTCQTVCKRICTTHKTALIHHCSDTGYYLAFAKDRGWNILTYMIYISQNSVLCEDTIWLLSIHEKPLEGSANHSFINANDITGHGKDFSNVGR